MRARTSARLLALAGLLAAALTALPGPAASAAGGLGGEPEGGVWIVRLAAPPLASHTGADGTRATSPAVTGRRLDLRSAPARAHRARLDDAQAAVLRRAARRVPEIRPGRSYRTALAGFAARLTPEQVAALARDPQVASVEPNVLLRPDATASTPPAVALGGPVAAQSAQLLGLPNGLWSRLGGPLAADGAGAGKVIGIIDTGLDPDGPSFADAPAAGYLGAPFGPPPAHFKGTCEPPDPSAPAAAAFACNGKVVGARWYLDGSTAAALAAGNLRSARDVSSGHGTHVAGIAAGNYGVDPAVARSDLDVDVLSGIAPRARIAVYKACWVVTSGSGCPLVEILSAFEDAVADGVDAVNFSIGTTFKALPNATAHAILATQEAGVAVAQSAGNAGPGADTVGASTAAWWALSVGATTGAGGFTDRGASVLVTAPSVLRVSGLAASSTTPDVPVVRSPGAEVRFVDPAQYVRPGYTTDQARRCETNAVTGLPAAAVAVCDRGTVTIEVKGRTVADAGGSAVVLRNDADGSAPPSLSGGTAPIPVVAVTRADGDAVRALAAAAGARAQVRVPAWRPAEPDVLASFSSRGPTSSLPALMPVSVAAPGVEVLAAYPAALASGGVKGLSGTSMASPQVAGVLALLQQSRGDRRWTPDELRSALVTTAVPVKASAGGSQADPYLAGGGRVDPQRAADPGLVLREAPARYHEAVRASDPGRAAYDLGPVRDAVDLNLPYVSARDVTGSRTARRTFTSVADTATTWSVTAPARAGWSLTPSPATFTVEPGGSATVALEITAQGAPADATTTLELAEQGGRGRRLSLPVMLRAAPGPVPGPELFLVAAAGPDGSATVPGQRRSAAWQATTTVTRLLPEATEDVHSFDPSGTCTAINGNAAGNRLTELAVAAGTEDLVVRTVLHGSRPAGAGPDIDLFLYAPGATSPTASALTMDGDEWLRVRNPAAGTWRAEVANCGNALSYDLRVTRFGAPGEAGTPLTAPAGPVALGPGDVQRTRLSWSGLPADGDHLARVTTSDGGASTSTLVVVSRRPAPVLGAASATADAHADADGADVELVAAANPSGTPTWARVAYDGEPPAGAAEDPVYLGAGNAAVTVRVPLGRHSATGALRSVRLVLERRGQALVTGPAVPVVVRRAPAARTLAPTDVTATGAVLRGTVDPNGIATQGRLVHGTGDEPAVAAPAIDLGDGDEPVAIAHELTGLSPSTTYSVRADALRDGGPAARGDVVRFTTAAASGGAGAAGPGAAGGSGTGSAAPATPITRTPFVPVADRLTKPELGAAVRAAAKGARRLAGAVARTVRGRSVSVRIRPRTTLSAASVRLHPVSAGGVAGVPVARARLGTVRSGRRRTRALTAPAAGTYLVVVDGRQRRRTVRHVAPVVVR